MAEDQLASRRVPLTCALGLHLRAAGALVKLAATYDCEVWVACGDLRANGKSILDLMTLAAGQGATLEIEARGPDAAEAVTALSHLVAAGFDLDEDGDETKA